MKGFPEPKQIAFIVETFKRFLPSHSFALFVFGSRAKGTSQTGSDLDILVETAAPITLATRGFLNEAFETSDLPFKVDWVVADQLEPAYRDEIVRTAKKILE